MSSENDIILNAELDIFVPSLLEGIREYLFMDFHALMNNEIFYSYQPAYLRNCSGMLDETELREIDELAGLCYSSAFGRTVTASGHSNRFAMGRMLPLYTFSYGLRSKCADLAE